MKKKIFKIVLIRHGESLGNLEDRFTGWLDVDLTKDGYLASYKAGMDLRDAGYRFDVCYTSMLKRAIKTSWAVLDALNLVHIRIIKEINLNERNYGDISGMDKIEAVLKYGKENVKKWLNNDDCAPPSIINKKDIRLKLLKKKYNNKKIPKSESLKDLLERVLIVWEKRIKKNILKKNILIVAHSNILKILTNYIDNKDSKALLENSKPIIYEFDKTIKKIKSYTL